MHTSVAAGIALGLSGCGAAVSEGPAVASLASGPAQSVDDPRRVAMPAASGPSGVTSASAAAKPGLSNARGGSKEQLGNLSAPSSTLSSGYLIGAQDVLEISVFKVPELNKVVQVSEAGTIGFPLVGSVGAAGRTAREIEGDLAKTLGSKYLRSPQVSVLVKEYNSQRATVEGAVKKPGVYPLKGKTTLMQILAMSEGVDSATASNTIVVFRQEGGKRSAARFDLDELRAGSQKDPDLRAGDMVVVDTSTGKAMLNNVLKLMPLASVFAIL